MIAVPAARARWARPGVLAGFLLAAIGLAVGALASGFTYDDAWITYRYAYNLAAGHGFVYNLGERMFGTSAPGYALVLALLSLPSPAWVPDVSALLGVLTLTAAGLALHVHGMRQGATLAGFVAGLVFVVNPLAVDTFGGEMVPQAALALWGLVAVTLDRPLLATGLGIAATMVRPDGLIALAIIVTRVGWRQRRVPWLALAGAVLALVAWFGGLWLYFGTPVPDTLAAKQAQRLSGLWNALGTDLGLWVLSLSAFPTPFMPPRTVGGFTAFLALAIGGLCLLPWRRQWWGVAAWPLLAVLAYRQMRLPFYHWYAVPPLVLLAIGAGVSVEAIAGLITRLVAPLRLGPERRARFAPAVTMATGAIVTLAVAAPMARHALDIHATFPWSGERSYIEIGRWLARETPPGASVGYVEVGFIGYYSQRPMIEPFGLVTPGNGAGIAQRDLLFAYRTRRPDFLLYQPAQFPKQIGPLVDEAWFKAEYAPVAALDSGGRGAPITVYRRTAPPPRE